MMCVPTSSRGLAGIDQQAGVEPALGLGEPVAHLLEPPGQAGIVEGEPDVILDDAQSLARAIGRGIEDPRQVDAPAGLDQVQRGDVRRPSGSARTRRRWPASGGRGATGAPGRRSRAAPRRGRKRPSDPPADARCRPRACDRAPGPGSSPRSGPAARPPTGATARPPTRRPRVRLGSVPDPRVHGLPQPGRRDAELRQQLRRSTLRLERQRGQQVQRLDLRRAATPRHRLRAPQRPLRSRRVRLEHQPHLSGQWSVVS